MYDAGGNLLSLTDAESQTTSYTYNDAGQRITEQYPDHIAGAVIGDAGYGIITFTYDALGRRTVKEDQQGDTTSYNFDMSGRMVTRVYVGHPTSPLAGQTDTDTFTYDRNGRMLSGIKGRYNNTVTFSYDDRGQQIQETLTTHGQTYTVGYQKNELGQTTQLHYPDGSLVDRDYTPRGQLLSVDYSPAGAAASSDVADFVYDAGGRETTRNLGNGLTTSRSYFADNQIQSIATPTVETLTYTYDPNKNPTSETRSGVMAPYSWSTGPTGFDDEDRLTNWQRTNGDTQTWNLSPVHDWTSTTINGALQTRTHGPAHEILTMAGAEVSPTPAVLQHDTKGNMTSDDRGCGMGWDFDNMLQSFAANGVTGLKDATYGYDAIGRRVAKNVAEAGGTRTTLFVQAGQQVVCEYTPGNTVTDCDRKSAYGTYIDETILFVDASEIVEAIYSFSTNRQYSVYAVTGAAGDIGRFYDYNSFGFQRSFDAEGSPISNSPLSQHQIGFTGQKLDIESGLMQFRARTYGVSLGRFFSRDPMGYVDGLSVYNGYFAINGVDPLGMQSGTLVGSCGGPPGILIGAAVDTCIVVVTIIAGAAVYTTVCNLPPQTSAPNMPQTNPGLPRPCPRPPQIPIRPYVIPPREQYPVDLVDTNPIPRPPTIPLPKPPRCDEDECVGSWEDDTSWCDTNFTGRKNLACHQWAKDMLQRCKHGTSRESFNDWWRRFHRGRRSK